MPNEASIISREYEESVVACTESVSENKRKGIVKLLYDCNKPKTMNCLVGKNVSFGFRPLQLC